MGYRFLDDEATADVAFEACGNDLNEAFRHAAEAVIKVMIDNPEAIEPRETRAIDIDNKELDLLLFNLLEQVVYYKDAGQLLLRVTQATIRRFDDTWHVHSVARGERLDTSRHHQHVDVKAVTLHHFSLKEDKGRWCAHVVLDI